LAIFAQIVGTSDTEWRILKQITLTCRWFRELAEGLLFETLNFSFIRNRFLDIAADYKPTDVSQVQTNPNGWVSVNRPETRISRKKRRPYLPSNTIEDPNVSRVKTNLDACYTDVIHRLEFLKLSRIAPAVHFVTVSYPFDGEVAQAGIRSMCMKSWEQICGVFFDTLPCLPQLETLEVSGISFTEQQLASLSNLARPLQLLQLIDCLFPSDFSYQPRLPVHGALLKGRDVPRASQFWVPALFSCNQIRRLSADFTDLTKLVSLISLYPESLLGIKTLAFHHTKETWQAVYPSVDLLTSHH
jgi:hypothetical protein